MLFPHLRGLRVGQVEDTGDTVVIRTSCRAAQARCPLCGAVSSRVHGGYARVVADGAAGGRPVLIALSVRRFRCPEPSCPKATFAEQADGVPERYQTVGSGVRRALPPHVHADGRARADGREPGLLDSAGLRSQRQRAARSGRRYDVAVQPWGYRHVLAAKEGAGEAEYYADKKLGNRNQVGCAPGTIAPGETRSMEYACPLVPLTGRSRLWPRLPALSSRTPRATSWSGRCALIEPGLPGVSSGGGVGGGNAAGICRSGGVAAGCGRGRLPLVFMAGEGLGPQRAAVSA